MSRLSDQLFICLDCETTGLDPVRDQIIEVALLLFTPNEEIDRFTTLVNPGCPIPENSIAIHHITNEMVLQAPPIEQVLPKLLAILQSYPIVGHGIEFDVTLLANACGKHGLAHPFDNKVLIDTLRMARLYGDSPTNSLEQLGRHFNIGVEGTHRAMNDVEINVAVFKQLLKFYKNLDELLAILEKPILMKHMPLGKHKGSRFKDIPLPYLKWAVNKDFDRDLLHSLRTEIKRRQQGTGFLQATNPFSGL